nr:zinc ribbon domain-containing protein [Clostridia bacterium]
MYCKYCGKEINDEAEFCVHCGRSTGYKPAEQQSPVQQTPTPTTGSRDKTGVGFALSFFLGIIGLIIGVCMYPPATEERAS